MEFTSLTQLVKNFEAGGQLQQVKTYRVVSPNQAKESTWILSLDFYPTPRGVGVSREGWTMGAPRSGMTPAPSPLQLYLKAHFANQRVRAVVPIDEMSFRVEFLPSAGALEFRGEPVAGGSELRRLTVRAQLPGRADYVQTLNLAPAPSAWRVVDKGEAEGEAEGGSERLDDATAAAPTPPSEVPGSRSARKKYEKLAAKVQSDVDSGAQWLARFEAVCEQLRANPSAWAAAENWEAATAALIEAEIQERRLPPWGLQWLGRAQDLLFAQRRRARRKVEGGEKRLVELAAQYEREQRNLSAAHDASQGPRVQSGLGGAAVSLERSQTPLGPSAGTEKGASGEATKPAPKKKPGLWVELATGIWARVGRSAQENAELFRQARDRDLWFHVRGQSGAHVWIPRGQAGLPPKGDAPDDIVQLGAMLALFNSRARAGGAEVDCTERRGLRSIRGAPGKLEILRSSARFVRLTPAFEKQLAGK